MYTVPVAWCELWMKSDNTWQPNREARFQRHAHLTQWIAGASHQQWHRDIASLWHYDIVSLTLTLCRRTRHLSTFLLSGITEARHVSSTQSHQGSLVQRDKYQRLSSGAVDGYCFCVVLIKKHLFSCILVQVEHQEQNLQRSPTQTRTVTEP